MITTVLELAGMLLFVAAAYVALGLAGALAMAGFWSLLLAWVLVKR